MINLGISRIERQSMILMQSESYCGGCFFVVVAVQVGFYQTQLEESWNENNNR